MTHIVKGIKQLRIRPQMRMDARWNEINTLLRTLPGSFRDSPAPRLGAACAARPPYHGSEVLASADHPIRFGPEVGA